MGATSEQQSEQSRSEFVETFEQIHRQRLVTKLKNQIEKQQERVESTLTHLKHLTPDEVVFFNQILARFSEMRRTCDMLLVTVRRSPPPAPLTRLERFRRFLNLRKS
jgi:hypothetical protein